MNFRFTIQFFYFIFAYTLYLDFAYNFSSNTGDFNGFNLKNYTIKVFLQFVYAGLNIAQNRVGLRSINAVTRRKGYYFPTWNNYKIDVTE